MAQSVLWEFKHIKTIKLCHLFWCTIAPCACLAQGELMGGSLAIVTISDLTRPKQQAEWKEKQSRGEWGEILKNQEI